MAATRASDAERDSCVDDIEAAFADGRIDDAEREARTHAALQATTVDQLAALVADLRPQSFPAAQQAAQREAQKTSRRQTPSGSMRTAGSARFEPVSVPPPVLRGLLGLATVAAVAAIVVWTLASRNGEDPTPVASASSTQEQTAPPERLRLHTVAGFAELRDQIREKFGSTRVVDATLYPDYASVEVVQSADTRRTERWYFARGFEGDPNKDTRDRTDGEVDLDQVDAGVLIGAIRRAPAVLGVEDVNRVYALIRAREGPPTFVVHVSNEYNESGYYELTLDGTEIYRSELDPL